MQPLAEAKTALAQAKLRKLAMQDLYTFNTKVLGVSARNGVFEAGDPRVKDTVTDIGLYIRDWLKARTDARAKGQRAFSSPKKVLYVMPRECMKSAYITAGVPPYAHCWEPDIAVGISSAVHEDMAVKYGKQVAKHWEGKSEHSRLVELFGEFKDPASKLTWKEDSYVSFQRQSGTRRDPTLGVFSVSKGAVGGHFDMIILDDPVTREKVAERGDGWHEKVWEHYHGLYPCVRADGMFILVMTRYGDGDLVGRIVESEIEPAVRALAQVGSPKGELPDDFYVDEGWVRYAHLAGWKVIYERAWDGNITSDDASDYTLRFPVVWPRERILAWMGEKGEEFVMSQLQNLPSKRSDNPIQQETIARAWIKPEDIPPQAWNHLTMHCDLAFKSGEAYIKQRGDYSVIQIWGHHAGHVYLLNGWFGRVKSEAFIAEWLRLWKWAKETKGSRIRVLTYDKPLGGVGDTIANLFYNAAALEGLGRPRILELQRGQKKIDRILAAAGHWQDGSVHLAEGVYGSKELADQMLKIGYSRYDDLADAAADCFHEEVFRAAQRHSYGPGDRDSKRVSSDLRPVAHGHVDRRTGAWVSTPGRGSRPGQPAGRPGRRPF